MKRSIKALLYVGGTLLSLTILYAVGPVQPETLVDPTLSHQEYSLSNVDSWIQTREASIPNIRPGNEARVFWADTVGQKTTYALVYLHGFSASRAEGDPLHLQTARRYGMNAFLPRLDHHGLEDPEALLNLTATSLLNSAKEAIQIGKTIGEKVIIMSCSTGSTLALYLAAHHPDLIDGLICYSPNVDLDNPATHLLDGPWGLKLLELIEGGTYHQWDAPDSAKLFWNTSYRIEAIVALRHLLDQTMTRATFERITQPLLVLYYYKSESERDKTVSIKAMKTMFNQVDTPESLKRMYPIPNAGYHVIGSRHYPNDLETVWKYTREFLENNLDLQPSL